MSAATLPQSSLESRPLPTPPDLPRLPQGQLPTFDQLDGGDERYTQGKPTRESFLLANTTRNDLRDPFLRKVRPPVKRSAVPEGVASTSDGRGGRVTSGSNAPHYTAEFLQRPSETEKTLTHGGRLAHAMDISPFGHVIQRTSPPSPSSPPGTSTPSSPTSVSWKDCKWERPPDASPTSTKPAQPRRIPTIPYRVLDAPALRDDYYCSLLAYSPILQCLAVGLGPHVYLWTEGRTDSPHKLPDSLRAPIGSSHTHVTSLSFSSATGTSAILAIGRGDGRVTLWSPLEPDARFDYEQPAPISCVCFRPCTQHRCSMRDSLKLVDVEVLLVGDEVGNVYLYSIEGPDQDQRDLFDWHGSVTLLAKITCHAQQICGMAWSRDGNFFATGGNDNNLFLFDTKQVLTPRSQNNRTRSNLSPTLTLPTQYSVLSIGAGSQKHLFTLKAACKAVAFAPWQPSLIAAGGGSNDRCIHFFHANSGAKLATIDCHAQVTSLLFNPHKREIAATLGFAQPEHPYRVVVFAWPSCRMVMEIPWWGEERALYGIEYPGQGGSLVVATSDASIKFHEVWSSSADAGGKGGRNALGSPILDDETRLEREDAIR